MRFVALPGTGLGSLVIPLIVATMLVSTAHGQHPGRSRPVRAAVPTTASAPDVCQPCEPASLGTFEPTPYLMVRGNWPAGGGYSPLGLAGDQSMSLYGPLSPLRSTSAPVTTYTRGYDGRVYASQATSSSTPNLPGLSPVVYPTQGNYYYGPRVDRSNPSWSSGMHWIDQR